MTSWEPISDTDRLYERAAALGRPGVTVQMKIAFLRAAVRAAVAAEAPRGQHAPAKASRLVDLHTDLVMDALLRWAAAVYPTVTPTPIKYGRGRPPKGAARPATPPKPRGHPRAVRTSIVGRVFIEQWRVYFPDYGRGRGARRRAELRDTAAMAFMALVEIIHSNPRNVLKASSPPEITDLPSN